MEGLATQSVIAPRAAEVGYLSRAGAKPFEERSLLSGVLKGPSIQHWNAREGLFAWTNRDPRVPALPGEVVSMKSKSTKGRSSGVMTA